MKRRKLAKRVKQLEREVAKLKRSRMWEPLEAVDVTGDELDPHALLREAVADWQYGYDDGDDWTNRGYL